VQPVSLDEAFVDLAAGPYAGDPAAAADLARRLVYNRSGLVVSVGLGRSKLIAKLASDAEKPHGFTVVPPEAEDEFLLPKPVSSLWGVGPATDTTLRRLGIVTVADLRATSREDLVRTLGEAAGWNLYRLARGDDPRPVVVEREAKSVGAERTFAEDLRRWELAGALEDVLARALRRLGRHGGGARTVTVKVRLSDFTTVTRSVTLAQPTSEAAELREAATTALAAADPVEPVRLLGVALSGLTHWAQLRLRSDEPDDATLPADEAAPQTVDPVDPADDDDDDERLPAPLTLHTCAVGLDVEHDEHGTGWISRVDDGVVTVRFEGPGTPPGPERRFDVRRTLLMRIAPPPPTPPRKLTALPGSDQLVDVAPLTVEGSTPPD
jgi:DNA polymerase-4